MILTLGFIFGFDQLQANEPVIPLSHRHPSSQNNHVNKKKKKLILTLGFIFGFDQLQANEPVIPLSHRHPSSQNNQVNKKKKKNSTSQNQEKDQKKRTPIHCRIKHWTNLKRTNPFLNHTIKSQIHMNPYHRI